MCGNHFGSTSALQLNNPPLWRANIIIKPVKCMRAERTIMEKISILAKALEDAGINAVFVETVKNNVIAKGFKVSYPGTGDDVFYPIVYYSPGETAQAFVEKAKMALKQIIPRISVKEMFDPDYIRNHAFFTVQQGMKDNALTRPLLNLHMILRMKVKGFEDDEGSIASMVLNEDFISEAGIDPDEVWDCARKNMTFNIQSMAYSLGIPFDENFFYIVTTKECIFGASALAYPEIFEKFCCDTGHHRLWILPSSTQEVLILPDDKMGFDADALAEMVKEVNESVVPEQIQLPPVPYLFDVETGEIRIARAGDKQ